MTVDECVLRWDPARSCLGSSHWRVIGSAMELACNPVVSGGIRSVDSYVDLACITRHHAEDPHA